MTKSKTLLKAGVFAAVLSAPLAFGGIASAQEAPAPPPDTQPLAVLPCNLTVWLENGIRDSADVVCLQTVLRTKGIDTGPIDGWFGPVTERAVTAFQVAAAITADGEVGQETATALGADMVAAYSGAATDPSPDRVVVVERSSSSSSSGSSTRSSNSSSQSSSSGSSSSYSGPSGASGVNWANVAQCESGTNWNMHVQNSYGWFGGAYAIMDSAWRQFGGTEFAAHGGLATPEQQTIVAERIAARVGFDRAWQCGDD